MKNYRYILKDLDCADCAKKIEDKLSSIDGYENVTVNFSTCKLSLQAKETNNEKEFKNKLEKIINQVEPDVILLDEKEKVEEAERGTKDIIRLFIGVFVYLIGTYLALGLMAEISITVISLAILLYRIAKKAYKQIVKNHVLDENTLITISSIGACFVGKSMEGIMVIVLYEIGKILEAKAVSKTRKSISDLMDIKPEYANLKQGEKTIEVNPEEVKIGDVILIKTGEKIPLDGIVIKGEAEVDNSALTGESKLVKVTENSKVLSGGINVQGLLEVKVEKTYENSTVSQILNLVENATDKKAKTETFVAKAAKIYTPVVLLFAVLVAVFMPMLYAGISYSESVYKALIFLVIACPCSIAISVPLSYFSGIGKASKKGILIKGSDYLDGLKDVGQILFDKTGTITTGSFTVSKVNILDKTFTEEEILKYFAMGESYSNHPIAKSILKKYGKEVEREDKEQISNFQEIAGKGLEYQYKENNIKIGNGSLVGLEKQEEKEDIGTILYLKIDEKIVGSILLEDEIKEDSKQTMQKLSKLGIKTEMLTGDKKEIATKIAKEVGINHVKAEMLPQDKYKELENILQQTNNKVAYVGDGINDSPVLARADIGISMGGIGSSSAIEASDVVIMTDELGKIVDAIEISKKTNKIIKENLIFSIGVKLLIFAFSLLGIADMWEAVFADVGTTLITIFNTLRILKKD